ncbi:MAG TPA: hypothetical protein VK549_06005 [Acidimicrobiia bacterium]|nr:hypothetical protein [Acidimicrobiia bacterium]
MSEVVPISTAASQHRHERPDGVDDATVAAVGKVSEALEWVERARGRLYDFHQMMGHADFLFEAGADALAECGHDGMAEEIRTHLVGRNVIDGRWTFQVVEEFDELYYDEARRCDRLARDELLEGRSHVYEAELKEARRSRGLRGHEAAPA